MFVFLCGDVWGLLLWPDPSFDLSLFELPSLDFTQNSPLIALPVRDNIAQ